MNAVAVMLILFKLKKPVSPPFLNPRSTTFGIYLTHTMTLAVATAIAKRTVPKLGDGIAWGNAEWGLALSAVLFLASYAGSLGVRGYASILPQFRWTVGGDAANRRMLMSPSLPESDLSSQPGTCGAD
jgi:hypothetical protein